MDINYLNVWPSFDDFWDTYDKKVGLKEKLQKKWNKLSQKEKVAVMEYIPLYKQATPEKQYRKNPETFLNNKSWNDELIIKNNGKSITENNRNEFANFFADLASK